MPTHAPLPTPRRLLRLGLAAAMLAALAGCASWRGGAADDAPEDRPALREGWRWREQLPADAVTGSGDPAFTAAIGPDGALVSVPDAEATIRVSRITSGGEGTMVSIANQTDRALKFEVFISPDGERWTATSSCPAIAGGATFESWPYPVAFIAIASPRPLAEGEPATCE